MEFAPWCRENESLGLPIPCLCRFRRKLILVYAYLSGAESCAAHLGYLLICRSNSTPDCVGSLRSVSTKSGISASSRARAASALSASAQAKFRELPIVMHRRRMLCSSSTTSKRVFSSSLMVSRRFSPQRSLIAVREMVFQCMACRSVPEKLASHYLRYLH